MFITGEGKFELVRFTSVDGVCVVVVFFIFTTCYIWRENGIKSETLVNTGTQIAPIKITKKHGSYFNSTSRVSKEPCVVFKKIVNYRSSDVDASIY